MGGSGTTPPTAGTTTPGATAKLKNGFAIPPASAPLKVKRAIEAANEIVKGKPYCMGGGHQRRVDRCYDCSGTVSYALTGAGLLEYAMPSGSFMGRGWGKGGAGEWITTYANGGPHLRGDRRAAARHIDDRRRRTRLEHGDALRPGLRSSPPRRPVAGAPGD